VFELRYFVVVISKCNHDALADRSWMSQTLLWSCISKGKTGLCMIRKMTGASVMKLFVRDCH